MQHEVFKAVEGGGRRWETVESGGRCALWRYSFAMSRTPGLTTRCRRKRHAASLAVTVVMCEAAGGKLLRMWETAVMAVFTALHSAQLPRSSIHKTTYESKFIHYIHNIKGIPFQP